MDSPPDSRTRAAGSVTALSCTSFRWTLHAISALVNATLNVAGGQAPPHRVTRRGLVRDCTAGRNTRSRKPETGLLYSIFST